MRKRKRGDAEDDLEDRYLQKLAQEEDAGLADKAKKKFQRYSAATDTLIPGNGESILKAHTDERADTSDISNSDTEGHSSDASSWTPPKHETETAVQDELDKAARTVFLGNVSVTAITSKPARKALEKHLTQFALDKGVNAEQKSLAKILESLRFRSTPYSPLVPKKASFARKEVATTTAQSTNAYAIYATQAFAREAARRLNGSTVLDRHLRVDLVAHPAPVEHRKCVFVGNLGFVDDESNIVSANEAEGREKRKLKQKPSDVEEGLWRLFGKHGTVESVRVIRDQGTRVGKGIAYVQFTDENAVESALAEDGQKDPPMLPRRLRVMRAKAIKKKATTTHRNTRDNQSFSYRRKVTPGEATLKGRVSKLMGKAAAASASKQTSFKPPESFVFEGHRAKAGQGKTGLKLGRSTKRKGKPTNRSTRRAATFRASMSKEKSK